MLSMINLNHCISMHIYIPFLERVNDTDMDGKKMLVSCFVFVLFFLFKGPTN